MKWEDVGGIEVGPSDREVLVGPFLLQEGHDTLAVKVTMTNTPDCETWNYSYGLLTWRTSEGDELGTVKVYGKCAGEVYKLGIGLPPSQRYGDLIFTPRSWNRRWIAIDDPPLWKLAFQAQSAKSQAGACPELPPTPVPATLGVIGDIGDTRVSWTLKDDFAFLNYST